MFRGNVRGETLAVDLAGSAVRLARDLSGGNRWEAERLTTAPRRSTKPRSMWVERALRTDDSLFTPGVPIWSSRWLRELAGAVS